MIILIILSVGGLVIGYDDTSVNVGTTIFQPNINNEGNLLNPIFVGFVESKTEIYFYNSGLLDIENVIVDINAYFVSFLFSDSRSLVGMDSNELGTLPSEQSVTKIITIDLNLLIGRLAIEDGIIELELDITFHLQFIPYEFSIFKLVEEQYMAPFSP
jgi:hypothetical protein